MYIYISSIYIYIFTHIIISIYIYCCAKGASDHGDPKVPRLLRPMTKGFKGSGDQRLGMDLGQNFESHRW